MALPPASGPPSMFGNGRRNFSSINGWKNPENNRKNVRLEEPEQPYPIPVQQAIKCEDIAIITWMDAEIKFQ